MKIYKRLIFTLVIINVCLLYAIGCTAPDWTVETLHKAGFTKVRPGGYAFFSCGQNDTYATEFVAINPAGDQVSGVVCCGWMKACTVRF